MYAADSFSSTNLDKSLILYKQAASISYKIKYYEKLVECKQLIAANSIGYNDPVLLYSYLVDFENSFNNFKGYLGDKKQYFELELMLIYINYYVKIGDINKALSILYDHLSILKKINTEGNSKLDDIINDLYNIGELERQNGKFQKAIDDFSELSNLMKFRANDHMMVTRTYQKLAECNIYLNNFSSAEFYYQKALREEAILLKNKKMYREGVWYTIAYLHYSLGKLAFIKKEYENSLKELNLCISNNLKEKNSFDKLFDTYILKGEIYYK